jgi:hypothetical protein
VLRSWHAHIDRISCLVTPLSLRDISGVGGSTSVLGSPIESVQSLPLYHSAIARKITMDESPPSKARQSLQPSPSDTISLRPSPSQTIFSTTDHETSASRLRTSPSNTVSTFAVAAAEIAGPSARSPMSSTWLDSTCERETVSEAPMVEVQDCRIHLDSVVDRMLSGFAIEGLPPPACVRPV